MKIQYIKAPIFLGLVFSVMLSGCLKDKAFDNGLIQSNHGANARVVALGLDVTSTTNFAIQAFDNSNNDTTVDLVPVILGGGAPADKDIHVTTTLSPQLVTNYNDSNGTDYSIPPGVTVVNSVVTIPKGKSMAFLQVKFVPSSLIGVDYALGIKLSSVAEADYTISGNLDTGVVAILIKNIYDGTYLANGVLVHPSIGGTFKNKSVILYTSGALSVDMSDGQPGAGGTLGAYPRLTVDPATNKVTVTSSDPSLTFNGPVQAGYPNRYDPASKTFFINYGYTTSAPREAWDTLVYQGPR
ncbi:MAG TPA: DUF1735 domain-containing protein [Puia sp.]|jgi:hypothetical protein